MKKQTRPQKPRPSEAKKSQTQAARDARESQRGFTYGWLRVLFLEGMKQQQWRSRAEAARWLTAESEISAQIIPGGTPLCAWSDASREFSRDLYNKLKTWEVEHGLIYRPRSTPLPRADDEAEFSVFDRVPKT